MGFQIKRGEGVVISGVLTYEGAQMGLLRIDFLRNFPKQMLPELLHSVTLDQPGPWSVEVPKNLGDVNIIAFVDTNENGPSEGEPFAMIEDVTVGAEPLPGIDLLLSDEKVVSHKPPPGEEEPAGVAKPGAAAPAALKDAGAPALGGAPTAPAVPADEAGAVE